MLNRREILHAGSAGIALSLFPSVSLAAATTDRRMVFIIQRGAADGIGTLMPLGDPAFMGHRAALEIEGSHKLDGLFALHPALAETANLYAAKQALFVHAVASPYRERSHFDAQNVLESGGNAPYALKTGWLNRMAELLPKDRAKALAVSATIPLAMRGTAAVTSYAPSSLPDASADLIARVGSLYPDGSQLHGLWQQAVATRSMAGTDGNALNPRDAAAMGGLAAKLMAGPEGARIAMIETAGWDTHSQQKGRLTNQLKSLDALIANLKAGLGGAWDQTLVIVATEFGRTVAVNGTGGTDHGTGAVAMLLGGAVRGGRVLADWPGLSAAQMFEGRDLKPTARLDLLIASAASAHFGLDPQRAGPVLFPSLTGVKPIEGLIA